MNKKRLIIILTIIMSIFISFFSTSFADESTVEQEAASRVERLFANLNHKVRRDEGKNEYYFSIDLGDVKKAASEYDLNFDPDGNKLTYTKVVDGVSQQATITISAKVEVYYNFTNITDGNVQHEGMVTYNCSNLVNSTNGYFIRIDGLSLSNSTEYKDKKIRLNYPRFSEKEITNPKMMKLNTSEVAPLENLFKNGKTNYKLSYSITGPNNDKSDPLTGGETTSHTTTESLNNRSFWDFLKSLLEAFVEFGLDIISKILNNLVIAIGDGLKNLIDSAMDDSLTVGKIVYGQTERFSIDFWDPNPDAKSVSYKLKNVVNQWFNYFRGFGIAVYLIMLLYVGVRVLLASTGRGMDVAKEKLTGWAVGVVLLFAGPTLMRYAVRLNNSVITMVSQKRNELQLTSGNKDMMDVVRDEAISQGAIMLSIIYLIMIGQLLVLIMVYYKRAFMFSFLVTIYPIVVTYYVWEKTHKGGARSLENWTKEFSVVLLTQLVHAICYSVLIEGMYDALVGSGGGNYVLYILCVTFLFKAEGIVKQIFNVRSPSNTIGDLAASGATAFAVTKSVTSAFGKAEDKNKAQDTADEKEATKQANTLKTSTQANNIRKQVENEEKENRGDSENPRGGSNPAAYSGGGTQGVGTGASGSGRTPEVGSGTDERPVITASTLNNKGEDSEVQVQMPVTGIQAPDSTSAQSTPNNGNKYTAQKQQMSDLEKARIVQRQKALKAKNGGKVRKVAKFAVRNTGRVAGIVAGLAMGAAQGDVTKAVSNAATLGMVGAKLGNGVNKVSDMAVGRYAGAKMKRKSERGDYIKDLKEAGVSDQFIEEVYNNAKGEAIRKALAAEMSGTRRGGKPLGEVKFTGTIERETRD